MLYSQFLKRSLPFLGLLSGIILHMERSLFGLFGKYGQLRNMYLVCFVHQTVHLNASFYWSPNRFRTDRILRYKNYSCHINTR